MKMIRKKTKEVKIGNFIIGGDNPIAVQSMTNIPAENVMKNIDQINQLAEIGADLVRLAVKTVDEAQYLPEIIKNVNIPLCADIHFDYRIALKAIDSGISKIRINPGNIGDEKRTIEVVKAASLAKVPIRIGVNGGSIDKKKYPEVTSDALVDSAMKHVHILEDLNFEDIVVSIKSSDVFQTMEANKLFSEKRNYPLHVGLTEAGFGRTCLVQSSIAIGNLLLNGIGDTIRVSMTGDPLPEIDAAYDILRTLGHIDWGIKIISCPTCGRTDTDIDLLETAKFVENYLSKNYGKILKKRKLSVKVAVMGCVVNGPGEASHADFGIAGAGSGNFLLFEKGVRLKKIHKTEIETNLKEVMDKYLG